MVHYLYLDQRDLIDLATSRDLVMEKRLGALIQHGRAQVVLSFAHCIETWKYKDLGGRRAVAQYADSLRPWWCLTRQQLFLEEARLVIKAYLGQRVVHRWDLPISRGVTKSDCSERPFRPFRISVAETFHRTSSAIESSTSSFTDMLDILDEESHISTAVVMIHDTHPDVQARRTSMPSANASQMVTYIFGEEARKLGISAEQLTQFLSNFENHQTPALDVYVRLREMIHKDTSTKPSPSEFVDIVHAVVLPYVDAFSTDKRIWDYIRRARLSAAAYPPGCVRRMRAFRLLADAIDWLESTAPV